jgi:dihydroxyacid dehydratase/phosphogluconate dehydratase
MPDGCCHGGELRCHPEEIRMFLTQRSQNIPAICLNVGPMINGYVKDDLVGSGMIVWKGRELYAAGEINREELFDLVSKGFV